MAKKTKNNKKQTFNVYPYLGGYQHFMRRGGALPKFKEEGAVDPSVVAGRIKPHNKYAYANTYKGVVDEWRANNDPNYVPRGSFMGQLAGAVGATVDFGKSVGDMFDKDNYKPGGKWSKHQTIVTPGTPARCSQEEFTTEEECKNNGAIWHEATETKEQYGGLKYANQSITNTTDNVATLNMDNLERWNNMSKKEQKEFMNSGGRNTDLWWTPEEMADGKWNYMDIDPETGLPRYDGINLQASTMRGNALEEQTGNRMFSNKTKVKQPDGSYKYVYFDNEGNLSNNQVPTEYDLIEEGTGVGQLGDANATQMNIQYEVDEFGDPIDPSNTELASFDHYVDDEKGNSVLNENVEYDPNKNYGAYSQKNKFQSDQQKVNECEGGVTCPGKVKGTWVPDAEGGRCDCNEKIGGGCASRQMCDDPNNPGECIPCARYGKELTAFLKGGGTASEGAVLCDAYDKPVDPERAWAADTVNNYKGPGMNNDSDKVNRGLFPFKHGGQLPSYQSKGEIPADEKMLMEVRKLNLELEEGIPTSQIDSIETVRYMQDLVPRLKKAGFSTWDVIRYLEKKRPDLMEYRDNGALFNIKGWEGIKKGGLPNKKKYGGSLNAFVYGGALPKYQEAGPVTCQEPEEGCPEGQSWNEESCACTNPEIDMGNNSNPIWAQTNPPIENPNANTEEPMEVADFAAEYPDIPVSYEPEVPVASKYQLAGIDDPTKREGKGEFTCDDGVSKTREECEKNGGKWNDPDDMGFSKTYGDGPLQKVWNKSREFLNTGAVGAVKDTLIGQSAEQYCSDPKYKTKEECEKEGEKWTDQKGTGLVSLGFDHIMPMMHNIMGQNQDRKNELHKRSVSAEDMFAATESGVGAGQRGFYDINKGGYGDDLYGTGQIYGQIAQQGVEMPPQEQRDFSIASAYMNQEDGIKFDLNLLNQQKAYLGKMNMGGHLPKFQKTGEKPWYSKVADYTQTALSGVGLTPGPVGFVADAINTGISGTRTGYNAAIGDTEAAKIHGENLALNATSMIPGPAGWVAGGTALAKDAANYAGVTDGDKSVTTQVADAVTDKKPPLITENMTGPKKVGTTAKYGKEMANIDMDLYYELLRAGADIKIIR